MPRIQNEPFNPTRYYVYVYRDPRQDSFGRPIYVGKGTDDRAWEHSPRTATNRFFKHFLRGLEAIGLKPIIQIYRLFEEEADALRCERRLIAKIGRRVLKSGPLLNIDEGGNQPPVCAKELWLDPEYREKTIAAARRGVSSPEHRAALSARFKELWTDPEYRAKQIANIREIGNRPEVREMKRAATARAWEDPVYRAAATKGAADFMSSPEGRAAKSEESRRYWSDPDHRAKRIAAYKAAAANPAERERKARASKVVQSTPEAKARSGRRMKDIWDDPTRREKQAAAIAAGQRRATEQQSPEVREMKRCAASERHKHLWADPLWRANTISRMRERKELREPANAE